MNRQYLVSSCAMICLCVFIAPVVSAMDPAWTVAATTQGELSSVVISGDGSTVLAGGDQLIALSREGRTRWTGWSGSRIAISRDGGTIVSARDQVVRLISGDGKMIWDQSLSVPVTEVTMLPDASLIAAAGANHIRLINRSGAGFRQNISVLEKHVRLFPSGDLVVFTSGNGIETANLSLYSEWADSRMSQDMVEVTGNGSAFVSVTNNRVRMYSRGGNLRWERAVPGGNALSFALSEDGSTIVVGRDDNTLVVLDSGGEILWNATEPSWVESVAVAGDGNTIAAGCLGGTLAIYDRDGNLLGSAGTKNPIKTSSAAVSPDGTLIVVADSGAVYGFARPQFTQAPAAAVTTLQTPETAPPSPQATVSAAGQEEPRTTIPVTPKSAIPALLPLSACGAALLCARRGT